jgi:hypothetical protein
METPKAALIEHSFNSQNNLKLSQSLHNEQEYIIDELADDEFDANS